MTIARQQTCRSIYLPLEGPEPDDTPEVAFLREQNTALRRRHETTGVVKGRAARRFDPLS